MNRAQAKAAALERRAALVAHQGAVQSAFCLTLNLPVPPSINHAKGLSRGMVYSTKAATAWKRTAGWEAKIAGARLQPGKVAIHLVLRAEPQALDLDNAQKLALDAWTGIVYRDDCQVWRLTTERQPLDGQEPRLFATIRDYRAEQAGEGEGT